MVSNSFLRKSAEIFKFLVFKQNRYLFIYVEIIYKYQITITIKLIFYKLADCRHELVLAIRKINPEPIFGKGIKLPAMYALAMPYFDSCKLDFIILCD